MTKHCSFLMIISLMDDKALRQLSFIRDACMDTFTTRVYILFVCLFVFVFFLVLCAPDVYSLMLS